MGLREVLLLTGITGAILLLLTLQNRQQRIRQIASGLLISYVTTVLLVGGIELTLRCCYIESDNAPTLAEQQWWQRYMQMNSLGFRDREWSAADFAGQTVVAAVGDSFMVGYGINNVADRITESLAARLDQRADGSTDGYAVVNLGMSGSSTVAQTDALRTFAAQVATPDVVIWQYFLNDIEYTGLTLGISPIIPPLPPLAQESHLVNYLYWRLVPVSRITVTDGTTWGSWWEWLYAAYDNPGIWTVHRQELAAMVAYVASLDAELIVLLYPNLTDVVNSIPYVDRLEQALVAEGVAPAQIVKLFDAAAAWDPLDLTVSRRDRHPSASFNHYVADLLYTRYFAPDLTKVTTP